MQPDIVSQSAGELVAQAIQQSQQAAPTSASTAAPIVAKALSSGSPPSSGPFVGPMQDTSTGFVGPEQVASPPITLRGAANPSYNFGSSRISTPQVSPYAITESPIGASAGNLALRDVGARSYNLDSARISTPQASPYAIPSTPTAPPAITPNAQPAVQTQQPVASAQQESVAQPATMSEFSKGLKDIRLNYSHDTTEPIAIKPSQPYVINEGKPRKVEKEKPLTQTELNEMIKYRAENSVKIDPNSYTGSLVAGGKELPPVGSIDNPFGPIVSGPKNVEGPEGYYRMLLTGEALDTMRPDFKKVWREYSKGGYESLNSGQKRALGNMEDRGIITGTVKNTNHITQERVRFARMREKIADEYSEAAWSQMYKDIGYPDDYLFTPNLTKGEAKLLARYSRAESGNLLNTVLYASRNSPDSEYLKDILKKVEEWNFNNNSERVYNYMKKNNLTEKSQK